ncbi:hypothetical protein AMTRI_Chr08g160880 [Amborella trichopoda]|uniref:Copper transport protein n=1 Tax=Amborella trichopoda TaxID=13333 RepID=W1PX64_AMBTC|nr:copper transporter 3 [Amborella trichopoda]ERN12000.1 hypothetical protein AMTR_s00165p00035200 [Amborella trichopoda]|eukprot:XP_006850419.1 copper transporter 3 [Amborella trichopoda]
MAHVGDGMGDMHMPGHNSTVMSMDGHPMKKLMMHITLFWGKDVWILFHGWPGGSLGMYILSVALIYFVAILLALPSNHRLVPSSVVGSRGGRTLLHAVRVGLAYLLMLAVMSFNGGILVAAIVGKAVGFAIFSGGREPVVGSEAERVPGMNC